MQLEAKHRQTKNIIRDVWAPIQPAEYVILRSRETGMFCLFKDVISLLQHFERGFFKGVEVDFQKNGHYYDPSHGPNWWGYYFEPIKLGKEHGVKTEHCHLYCGEIVTFFNTREYNNYLVTKYIKVQPHIQVVIDNFANKNFANSFVIGIHYRGTDKWTEAPRVPYEAVAAAIDSQIDLLYGQNYKIFVASDEAEFICYLNNKFPGKVCSFDATNKHRGDYQSGEGALVDCILLSKTQILIRTSSSLSDVSSYFNPNLTVIDLNQKYSIHGGHPTMYGPYSGLAYNYYLQIDELYREIELHLGPREDLIKNATRQEGFTIGH